MDKTKPTILIIDDEQPVLNALYRTLRQDFNVLLSLNGQSALEVLRDQEIAAILADQRMPVMSGVEFFKQAVKIQPDTVRILITGYTDIEVIIHAVNEGQIFYYIHKPWEPEDLRIVMRRAVERYQLIQENKRLLRELEYANQRLKNEYIVLKQEVEMHYSFDNIIGKSPVILQVFDLMKKIIPTETTVLLHGETGTGKELIAKAIHFNGPRRNKMFVAQNCAALPDTLLESELFGYKKGAFTDASSDKKGLFEVADEGTIFLDEIADTSPAMQQRLLRVLQEGEINPLGSHKTVKINVRVISSTNRDLQEAVKRGEFREDLFYRLNVFPITLPPLRERKEDIPLLIEHFIKKYSTKMGKIINGIENKAIAKLLIKDFPGNIRELENLIERAIVLVENGSTISTDLFDVEIRNRPDVELSDTGNSSQTLKDITDTLEMQSILQALSKHRGNISKVASILGLSRPGLYKKIKRFGIDVNKYKHS